MTSQLFTRAVEHSGRVLHEDLSTFCHVVKSHDVADSERLNGVGEQSAARSGRRVFCNRCAGAAEVNGIYKSESEPGDQGQGGSAGDDDQVDGDEDAVDSTTHSEDGKTDRKDDDSVDHGKSSDGQY